MLEAVYHWIGFAVVWAAVAALAALAALFLFMWLCVMFQAYRANRDDRRLNGSPVKRIWLRPIRWIKFSWWLLREAGGEVTFMFERDGHRYSHPVPLNPFKPTGWQHDDEDEDD